MAQATPITATEPAAVRPRQWVCEEQPTLRLYLPRISARPRWRDMGLPEEFAGMYRKGDLFTESERWAHFVGGKFVTSDPDVQDELARIEREGLAPIYEDATAVGVYTCRAHAFTTTSEKAWGAHLRSKHKAGSAPQLYDVAQDDLGIEQEVPYEE